MRESRAASARRARNLPVRKPVAGLVALLIVTSTALPATPAQAATGFATGSASYNSCGFGFGVQFDTDGFWFNYQGVPYFLYGRGWSTSQCALLRISNGYYWNAGLARFDSHETGCNGCNSGWVYLSTSQDAWSLYHITPTTNSYNYAQIRHPSIGNWSPTYEVQASQ